MVLAILSRFLPPRSGRRPRCRYLHSGRHRGAPYPYGIITSAFGQKRVSVCCTRRVHLAKLMIWDPFLSLLLHFACSVQISLAYFPASSDQCKNHFGYVLVLLPPNRAGQGITRARQVRECTLRFPLFHPSSSVFTTRLLQSARR